jgi:two-component system nitrogen regulation response regulator NtrX
MPNRNFRILIVDDERKICQILAEILETEGYYVHAVHNGSDAMKKIQNKPWDLVLLDVKLPDADGLKMLAAIKADYPQISVVMISAYGTVARAVEALKSGADDFIEKPLEVNRVLKGIRNVQDRILLQKQSQALQLEMLKGYEIIGESPEIKRVVELIEKIAPTESAVLILGESGTGKELVARNIQIKSPRMGRPFIRVNCAALPGELIESELFGYEKGAFTGAYARKPGQIEVADNGTIFLDEIGDMSLPAQAKVLRAIEDHEIMHLGGTRPLQVDVRFITATNQNLDELIAQRKFREDLYHRINVIKITVPPLRDRKTDIPVLAQRFLNEACLDNNRPYKTIDDSAQSTLRNYAWPGNVRELKYLMERMAILIEKTDIGVGDVKSLINLDQKFRHLGKLEIEKARDSFEKEYLVSVLTRTNWRMSEAAAAMGIDRSTLFRKMRRLGIKKQQ